MFDLHFYISGVAIDASTTAIKAAYRAKAKEYHPDVSTDASSKLIFEQIQSAYSTLKDPLKRREYDIGEGVRSSKDISVDDTDGSLTSSAKRHVEAFDPENINVSYRMQMNRLRDRQGGIPLYKKLALGFAFTSTATAYGYWTYKKSNKNEVLYCLNEIEQKYTADEQSLNVEEFRRNKM